MQQDAANALTQLGTVHLSTYRTRRIGIGDSLNSNFEMTQIIA
jgi:hypothetical protein